MHIIGYAYEADLHCTECSDSRFGIELEHTNKYDREDNGVTPLWSFENHDSIDDESGESIPPFCGDCNKELE